MCKKIISDGDSSNNLFTGEGMCIFTRSTGDDSPPEVVEYEYIMWLCKRVGLNGDDPEQAYRKPETDNKTYFVLAEKLYNTDFKIMVPLDKNRAADGKRLREIFALLGSKFKDYSTLDKPNSNLLEVLVGLVNRFDTDVMMTSDEIDRSKEWFWMMMKNCGLDKFTDAAFMDEKMDANKECEAIIKRINEREYDSHGNGGFFPIKDTQNDQKRREMWLQMHEFFLENCID